MSEEKNGLLPLFEIVLGETRKKYTATWRGDSGATTSLRFETWRKSRGLRNLLAKGLYIKVSNYDHQPLIYHFDVMLLDQFGSVENTYGSGGELPGHHRIVEKRKTLDNDSQMQWCGISQGNSADEAG
jgi:hypothetical protein